MTPIIIIGPGRSGTSLLFDALSQHSQVESNGCQEPLCGRYEAYKPYHTFVKYEIGIDPEQNKLINPHQDLDLYKKFACQEYLSHILKHQNIIKILYPHFLLSNIKKYIHTHDSFVIHMCRRNITSTILSTEIQRNKSLNNTGPLSITEGRYVNRFFKILNDERFVDHVFDKKIFKIYYENLLEKWDFYMSEIQRRTDLNHEVLSPNHPKTIDYHFEMNFQTLMFQKKLKLGLISSFGRLKSKYEYKL